ncbi:AbrB/MazE/SpoVT family DNA-binding domain-containing protein [Rhodoferax sediminis]|jgi:antitoxin MazE|nr:PbsX family transcriptional regulator [Rhodoferax sediminis]
MEAVIKKWGNSPAVRLPVALMKLATLTLEQKVNVTAVEGKIIIEPLDHVEYRLEDLVKGITRSNSHAEVSFGAPVGKEAL